MKKQVVTQSQESDRNKYQHIHLHKSQPGMKTLNSKYFPTVYAFHVLEAPKQTNEKKNPFFANIL